MKTLRAHFGCPASVRGILSILLFLSSVGRSPAQDYTYADAEVGISLTGYSGLGGDVTIPAAIDGEPVTAIGKGAFQYNQSITNVVIPASVTNIGQMGMSSCDNLAGVVIPASVTNIGPAAFEYDKKLATVRVPNGVIGAGAFRACGITNAIIGAGVTGIGANAFEYCAQLDGVYFEGNAPSVTSDAFVGTSEVIVYYKPGTTGWGSTFGGLPTQAWNAQTQTGAAGTGGGRTNSVQGSDR